MRDVGEERRKRTFDSARVFEGEKIFNLEAGTELKAKQKASTVAANPEISCNLYISYEKACAAGVERPVYLKRAISS